VFVDQDPVAGITSINVDDRGGARAAAQHLVDLGHRRVAIITLAMDGPRGIVDEPVTAATGHPQKQRILGWLDALGGAGVHPTVVQAQVNSDDEAVDAARIALGVEPRPTAVLCFSDVMGLGVLTVAEELGLAVPEGVSVVGFDDNPVGRHSRPALTTVRQDVDAKGRLAAAALLRAIEHGRSGSKAPVRHLTIPTELVVRQSTARPPRGRRPRGRRDGARQGGPRT
jgi:DNA-binding LacI/PurR family transcriptional regulator